jgi:hypothetical protein
MAYLFAKLKKHADKASESPHLFTNYHMTALNHGFAKLSEYYTNTDDSPSYATAVVLHPCRRFTYFDENWSKTTGGGTAIITARQSTRRLFDEYLARAVAERELFPEQDPLFISNSTQSDSDDKDWAIAFGERSVKTKERTTTLRRRQETELNRFIDDDIGTYYTEFSQGKALIMSYADQPLCWWRERGEAIYPTLASMAYDLRAIPGMSSECERSCGAAKKMITDDRYSLSSMLERFKVLFFEGIRAPNTAPKQCLKYSIQFSVDTIYVKYLAASTRSFAIRLFSRTSSHHFSRSEILGYYARRVLRLRLMIYRPKQHGPQSMISPHVPGKPGKSR